MIWCQQYCKQFALITSMARSSRKETTTALAAIDSSSKFCPRELDNYWLKCNQGNK
jgi:hypothetical protein